MAHAGARVELEVFSDNPRTIHLYEKVGFALESCRRMAVVTSSVPVHCRTAMEKLDLMKYFESVTFAQELGIEKKNRELWLHVAERCGVEPQSCTLFDDSLAACKGARSAKMRVVGVYDGFFAADEKEMRAFCDVYIKSFEELLWKPEYRKG